MQLLLVWLAFVIPAVAGGVLVGTAPLPADGSTASTVRVYVERCPAGVRARVKAESGKVASVATGTDCVVSFSYTPPAVSQAKTLPINVTMQNDEATVLVPVVPPFTGEIAVSFDPPVLYAGQSASVKVVPSGTSPVAAQRRRFVLTATVGTVDSPVPLGDGTYAARYTAPKTITGPLMVALTAADMAEGAVVGFATLPLLQKKSVAFDAPVGSLSVLTLGGKQYGPFKADSKNKVSFELELDPRLPTGKIATVNVDTSKTEREVPMPGVPQQGQLVFLPLVASVVADASRQVPIRVVALAANGEPQAASDMILTASAGTMVPPGSDGRIMLGKWTPPVQASEVTIGASWQGLTANRKVRVLSSLPMMTLAADPPEFAAKGGSVQISARLKDAGGTALVGRSPQLVSDGGSLSGSVKDNKDGSYRVTVSGTSKVDRMRVYGAPQIDVSSLAPRRILAWPNSSTLAGNGLDSTTITVVAVDAFDLPVANVDFNLSVPHGDGVLPPTANSGAKGITRVVYKSGTAAGLQTLRIEGAGLVTELSVFQVGKGAFAAPPLGGSDDHIASVERWQKAAPSLTVVRAGVIPPSGPPATVQITTTPGFTTPGAAILVQIRVSDAAGVGVVGQKLVATAGSATVGTITDNRDGSYTFPAQLPAGTDGPVTINVAAGAATASLKLSTMDATAVAARASGSTTSSAASSVASAPAASGDIARGRFGAAVANVRGPYSISSDGEGGVAPSSFDAPGAGYWGLIGRVDFGAPVGPGRLSVTARGRLTANWYEVNGETYLAMMRDVTVGGRFLYSVNRMIGVGGGADVQSFNAPYFTYTDEARTAAELALGNWLGARLVFQLDIDAPSGLHASIDIGETFAWGPAATHAGVLVDIPVPGAPVAVRLESDWDFRYLDTEKIGSAGTLEEHVITAAVGVTYVLK